MWGRKKMRIEFIKLKNYRQYKDEKIDFPPLKGERNFIVIQGINDSGKTTLLNAITWCLYGEELHLEKELKALPMLNTLTFSKLKLGESCEVEVEIQMRDEKEQKINFKRNIRFKKLKNGEIEKIKDPTSKEDDGSKYEMLRQIKGNIIQVADAKYITKKLIPKEICGYFFFDGERLNEYFREAVGEKIKGEVFKISQLELLDKVLKYTEEKKGEFMKTSKNLTSKAAEIKDEIDLYQNSLKEYKEKREDLKSQIKEAEEKERKISGKLRLLPDSKQLEEERAGIEEDLKKLEDKIDDLYQDKLNYLIDMAPSIFIYKAIIKTNKIIDKKEEAGEIPPYYQKDFIEKLLKKGKCMCGTDISKKNRYRKKIKKILLECDEISNIAAKLIKTNTYLKSIINELEKFHIKQIKFGREIKSLRKEDEEKNKRLKKINERIGKSSSEEVKRLENKLQLYKEQIKNQGSTLGNMQARIEMTERNIKKLENDFEKEIKKEKKLKELGKILSFCKKSLEAIEKIKGSFMEETKKEIEELTKKQFFELIWKKETYKDIKIDDDYKISVVHQSGMEAIGSLGAGVRQALALSFIAALNKVSGFDVPIVIDTPLGRISKEHRKNIADKLPSYLKGKQVILLATDEEYTPEVRKRLSKRVAKEFKIEFKETKLGSIGRIVPYGK